MLVGGGVGIGAALTEDEAVRDVCPASRTVGKEANTHLVLARRWLDAELEVGGSEGTRVIEDVVEKIRQRASALLRGFEVVVEDVVASGSAAETELFACRARFVINGHPSSPTSLPERGG